MRSKADKNSNFVNLKVFFRTRPPLSPPICGGNISPKGGDERVCLHSETAEKPAVFSFYRKNLLNGLLSANENPQASAILTASPGMKGKTQDERAERIGFSV